MDRDEIYRQIDKTEKQNDRKKEKRNLCVTLFFSVVYYILLFINERPEGWELLLNVIPAVILGALHYLIHILILYPVFKASERENQNLEDLRRKLW